MRIIFQLVFLLFIAINVVSMEFEIAHKQMHKPKIRVQSKNNKNSSLALKFGQLKKFGGSNYDIIHNGNINSISTFTFADKHSKPNNKTIIPKPLQIKASPPPKISHPQNNQKKGNAEKNPIRLVFPKSTPTKGNKILPAKTKKILPSRAS